MILPDLCPSRSCLSSKDTPACLQTPTEGVLQVMDPNIGEALASLLAVLHASRHIFFAGFPLLFTKTYSGWRSLCCSITPLAMLFRTTSRSSLFLTYHAWDVRRPMFPVRKPESPFPAKLANFMISATRVDAEKGHVAQVQAGAPQKAVPVHPKRAVRGRLSVSRRSLIFGACRSQVSPYSSIHSPAARFRI